MPDTTAVDDRIADAIAKLATEEGWTVEMVKRRAKYLTRRYVEGEPKVRQRVQAILNLSGAH